MIAIALACGPKLLFADEPTTALDVTVQAQILDLLQAQQRERFMAMVLVTHDLGVVAGRTDDIAVMYAGRIVEKAPTRALFAQTRHPYTEALLKSIPKLAQPSHTRLEAISRPAARPRRTRRPGASSRRGARTRRPQCLAEEPPLERRRRRPATRSAASSRSGPQAGTRGARAQPRGRRDRDRACRCAAWATPSPPGTVVV